ncbi:hypothetical protein CULT_2060006 [[Clostridium] ultunense Esp]|nr:hypothetical protein CULT_2060006 [[Clostridium] ultunense Esp]
MLLKSNGYIIHKPIIRSVDLNRMKIEKLRRPNCFPILYHCRGERVTLFIRGRLIDMINVPGLLESINVINSKEQHKYDELLQNISLYLSEDIANWLLKQLISYGGLFLDN